MQRSLVVFPRAGLANRLRVIASAVILGRQIDRTVYVNWEAAPDCNASWSDLFENAFPIFPADTEFFHDRSCLYTDDRFIDPWREMANAMAADTRPVIAVDTFSHFWLDWKTYQREKSAFYQNLHPIPQITREVDDFSSQYCISKRVGIHIRRVAFPTDLGMNPYAVSPIGDFIKQCKIQQDVRRPAGFFLSTDSKRDRMVLESEFGNALVTRSDKALSRDTKEGIQDALVDWLLLSKTSFIIRSHYSSFSIEACVVHGVDEHVVARRRSAWRILLSDLCYAPRQKVQVLLRALRKGKFFARTVN